MGPECATTPSISFSMSEAVISASGFPGGGGLPAASGRAEVQDLRCHAFLFRIPTDVKLRSYFLCPFHLLPHMFLPGFPTTSGSDPCSCRT